MDILVKCVCISVTLFYIFTYVSCLSGHVCTRERAENYLTSYNQAFLCQERYTTSCGHLDWRRCTKYRVQTCFTPKQRYMTRYRQVEDCCSGWSEDGSGRCTVPVCSRTCSNGGSCVTIGNVPGCLCQQGFHGDTCQHEQNEWTLWYTVTLVSGAVFVMTLIGVAVGIGCRGTSEYRRLPQREIISMRSPLDITTYTTTQTDYCPTVHNNDDITKSVTPSAPTLNHVPPD